MLQIWYSEELKVGDGTKFLPVVETRRHRNVIKQNEMLDKLTQADASGMRTNRHWGEGGNNNHVLITTHTQDHSVAFG